MPILSSLSRILSQSVSWTIGATLFAVFILAIAKAACVMAERDNRGFAGGMLGDQGEDGVDEDEVDDGDGGEDR